MYNTEQMLTRLGLPNSATAAIVFVGDQIRNSGNMIDTAVEVINKITGVKRHYTDPFIALMTAQAVVKSMITDGDAFDPLTAIPIAELYANKFRSTPAHRWLFEQDSATVTDFTLSKQVGGVTVEVHASGKRKKGGGKLIAEALYRKYVLEAEVPVSSKEFVQILLTEGEFASKLGAITYSGNCKKVLGGEYRKDPKKAKVVPNENNDV